MRTWLMQRFKTPGHNPLCTVLGRAKKWFDFNVDVKEEDSWPELWQKHE